MTGWALVAAALVLVALAAAPFWAPILPWGPSAGADGRVGEVEKSLRAVIDEQGRRLLELERGLVAAQQRPPDQTPRLDAALQQQAQAVTELTRRLQETDRRAGDADRKATEAGAQKPVIDPAALQALQADVRKLAISVGELADRQGKAEAKDAEVARRADAEATGRATLLAVTQLRDAALSGRPFVAELAAVKALGASRPAMAAALPPLEGRAAAGVATLETLRSRFPTVAADIVRAEQAPTGGDITDEMLSRVRALVTVRRTGAAAEPAANPAEAAVAAAEAALGKGDLGGAVQVLGGLKGQSADAAKGWLADAKARLAAEGALGQLATEAAAGLRAGGAG